LAVAGTHGKTTTTSMLMLMLAEAGWRPSFVIGGDVHDMGTGAHWSGGEWFVVEADESDGTHLELPLHGTILTNVETDHLDHFGSLAAIEASFDQYLAQVPGPKVVCGDDPIAARLAGNHQSITYGIADGVAVRAVDVRPERG
jgi:UDP-N-acetylmuramate--alanine ligase